MSGLRNIAKGGWHPERNRDSSSGSGSGGGGGRLSAVRGMVPGSKAKVDREAREARENHVSQPLSSLRDPSSFGPPPKHVHYHGPAAAVTSPSATPSSPVTTAATRGLGAPLPKEMIQHQQQVEQAARQEAEAPPPPPGPYRSDTTGLSTAHLPKPPVRRLDAASPATAVSSPPIPPARQIAPSPAARAPLPPPRQTPTPPTAPPRQQPALPPRLPPRQNSRPDLNTPAPPPAYTEATQGPALNQGALNRLGQAGISVPAFNMGARTASPVTASPAAAPPQTAQLSELQSRFARMSSPSAASSQNHLTQHAGTVAAAASSFAPAVAGKRPPPPPPKKKELSDAPPVPLASKPKF